MPLFLRAYSLGSQQRRRFLAGSSSYSCRARQALPVGHGSRLPSSPERSERAPLPVTPGVRLLSPAWRDHHLSTQSLSLPSLPSIPLQGQLKPGKCASPPKPSCLFWEVKSCGHQGLATVLAVHLGCQAWRPCPLSPKSLAKSLTAGSGLRGDTVSYPVTILRSRQSQKVQPGGGAFPLACQ